MQKINPVLLLEGMLICQIKIVYLSNLIHTSEMPKKNQCLPKPLKSCTWGLDPPPPNINGLHFFLDIELWTLSLRGVCC